MAAIKAYRQESQLCISNKGTAKTFLMLSAVTRAKCFILRPEAILTGRQSRFEMFTGTEQYVIKQGGRAAKRIFQTVLKTSHLQG